MDWTRWTAWDNQIYTWIGSHQWIKNQQTENTLRNKGIDYRDTIEGNGINHRTTKTAHWTDIAKGQCGVFKRVNAAYGHQTAVHRVHLPGIFITRKDKGRDEAEIKESVVSIALTRSTDNRNDIELIGKGSIQLSTIPIVDF